VTFNFLVMLSPKDVAVIYETLLSSPGMSGTVKVSISVTRKTLLLLTKVIEHGLALKEEKSEGSLLNIVEAASLDELKDVIAVLLDKGGLTEMNDKLLVLQSK